MSSIKSLCIPSFDDINNLIAKKVDSISATFLTQEAIQAEENTLLEVVPYVTIYAVDVDGGKLMFIQTQRTAPEALEGEEPVTGMTTIGLNGSIASEAELVSGVTTQEEDGSTSYSVSLQNLIETGTAASDRCVKASIGVDLSELQVNIAQGESAFFVGAHDEVATRKLVGFSLQIQVTPEKFEEIKTKAQLSSDYTKLDILGVNLDVIVEEMDVSNTVARIAADLKKNHSLEDWSCRIFEYVTRKTIAGILQHVTYTDLVEVAKFRHHQAQQEQAEKANVPQVEELAVVEG